MATADKDFESIPCRNCGKFFVRFDVASTKMRCKNCHLSWSPSEKEKKTISSVPEKEVKVPASSVVTETYEETTLSGERVKRAVKRSVPKLSDDQIPDLSYDEKYATFVRDYTWDTHELDKRWGRDNLRKRGFVVVDRVYDDDHHMWIKIHAIPGREKDQGTGALALAEAVATATKRINEGPPPAPAPIEDEVFRQELDDLREFLAALPRKTRLTALFLSGRLVY